MRDNRLSTHVPGTDLKGPPMTRSRYMRHSDAMAENQQQTAGTRCTCTGGPYVHGPEGLRQALKEIAAASVSPTKEPTEGEPEE